MEPCRVQFASGVEGAYRVLAIPLSSHLLPKMGPRAQDDRGDNDGDDFGYLMRMRWEKGGVV